MDVKNHKWILFLFRLSVLSTDGERILLFLGEGGGSHASVLPCSPGLAQSHRLWAQPLSTTPRLDWTVKRPLFSGVTSFCCQQGEERPGIGCGRLGAGGPSCLTIHSGAEVRSLRAGLRVAGWGWGESLKSSTPAPRPKGWPETRAPVRALGQWWQAASAQGGLWQLDPTPLKPRPLEETGQPMPVTQ